MIELIRAICPYPNITPSGELRDGYEIAQAPVCRKCEEKPCLTSAPPGEPAGMVASECPKGLSVLHLPCAGECLVCNGLILAGAAREYAPEVRKRNRSQKVHWDEIAAWHKTVGTLTEAAQRCIDDRARESILGLHDVSTAVSLVTRNAESIINEYPGDSDYEKIENSPPHIKRLLKSVSLLRTRLAMSSIVANPESASFGQKRPTPVYKVFDRMVRLFEEVASQRGVTISISGPSHAKPNCFDSFETIALVLIDNAVKYSMKGHDVKVIVKDARNGSVKVVVDSFGPLVLPDMRASIFERGFRTPAAERACSKGSGLGLYIASVVARAHGFPLVYKAIEGDRSGSQGWNRFYFET